MTKSCDFKTLQKTFANAIRNPEQAYPLPDVPKRLTVYQSLIHNGMSNSLSSCFPVTKQIISADVFDDLVSLFLSKYSSHTPYFHQVPSEFLNFIAKTAELPPVPEFIFELMHYEWLELAVEIDDTDCSRFHFNLENHKENFQLQILPTVRLASYQYAVEQIGPSYIPTQALDIQTMILVFRNQSDDVEFMRINDLTALLLAQFEEPTTIDSAFKTLAEHVPDQTADELKTAGLSHLMTLVENHIIGCVERQTHAGKP